MKDNRKYPKYYWMKLKQQGRRHPQCKRCKQVTPDGAVYWRVDIQTTWFRGDDGVAYYCDQCKPIVEAEQKEKMDA